MVFTDSNRAFTKFTIVYNPSKPELILSMKNAQVYTLNRASGF